MATAHPDRLYLNMNTLRFERGPGKRTKTAAELALAKTLKAERSKSLRHLAKAKALAAQHGIEIERESADAYWVTHPKFADDEGNDPLEGGHFCSDGQEVLAAVQAYVDHFAKG